MRQEAVKPHGVHGGIRKVRAGDCRLRRNGGTQYEKGNNFVFQGISQQIKQGRVRETVMERCIPSVKNSTMLTVYVT